MRMRAVLVVLGLVAGACNSISNTPPSSVADSSTTAAVPTPTTATTSTNPSAAPVGCEGSPNSYIEDGPLGIVGGTGADAQLISGLRLNSVGQCERFEVSLSTGGGAPATSLPVTEVELIADSGVIRISFPASVSSSAITDSVLEGVLVERAYVVRSLEGTIFVDAHLSSAVAARTFVQQNPARVVVEAQPIDSERAGFPKVGGLVVVTGPTAGSVEYPIVVTGYARTFEATVLARVLSDSGTETEVATTAADYLELWGEFELTIDEGPGGDVTIFVGEESPDSGDLVGTEFVVSAG